jgi:hypothetical protein
MRIIKQGMDLSEFEVQLDCTICGCQWADSAESLARCDGGILYDGGDIPKPGQTIQLRVACKCPNCWAQINQAVDFFPKD